MKTDEVTELDGSEPALPRGSRASRVGGVSFLRFTRTRLSLSSTRQQLYHHGMLLQLLPRSHSPPQLTHLLADVQVATLRLQNKVAIITGAGNGIGLESALAFAAEGAHVVCADLRPEGAERAVKLISELEGGAPKAIPFVGDVGKEADIKAMVAKAVEEFGRLDVML